MRTKTDFLLREAYEKWLDEKKEWRNSQGKSASQYLLPLDEFPKSGLLYYDIIASFLYHNEPTYAFSVLEKWGKEGIKAQKDKSFKTYWKNYKEFIHYVNVRELIKEDDERIISEQALAPIRKSFNKKDLYQLDGMEALINKLGEKEIIKLAIESSYFFDSAISKARHEVMKEMISEHKSLPARKSQKDNESTIADKGKHIEKNNQLYYEDENGTFSCPIIIDGNGNAKVCQLINQYTGYQLEQKLEQKPFRHYIISHIWARASDPRYFTSLWNIVLIPAWVNHLLDKETNEGDIASILKSTYKKICIKNFGLDKYDWAALNMDCPESGDDACKGVFSVQVIHGLNDEQIKNHQKAGKIIKIDIKI